jgi:signal transduction histidine kinase
VSTAVNEADPLVDEESRTHVRDDIEVVNASLHFINDFMRSMLDIYRASGNKITVEKAPTDIKHDVLEPVSNILYKRLATFDVIVDCPDNLVVMTDSIRLKQVVLNLVSDDNENDSVSFSHVVRAFNAVFSSFGPGKKRLQIY